VTLLNFMHDIPERPRGMFDFGARLKVTRVTYRLLRSLKDQAEIERVVRLILPELAHLSMKWEVISDIGYHEGAGNGLVTQQAAADLEARWRQEVRSAAVDCLGADPGLLRVFLFAQRDLAEGEASVPVPDAPQVTHTLLRSSRNETLSQSADSYAVRREPRLAWDALVMVFGSETVLKERIDGLFASGAPVEAELKHLVQKYRSGWRPKHY
jgi:hypothetical protein